MKKILITGVTGNIGGRVAEILKGQSGIRLLTRQPEKLSGFPDAEIIKGDYSDKESLEAAFKDVGTAFIVSGYAAPGQRALLHKNAIEAAVRAGTGHIIYLSSQGASPESKFPMSTDHYQTEQFVKASGAAYTILRDSFYIDLIPEMFGEKRIMKGPGGQGEVAWVSREDIAQVIATVLMNPTTSQGTYEMTGPEAVSLAETAERFSAFFGEKYSYEEETLKAGREWRKALGAPDWEVNTWVGSYEAIAAGEMAPVSDDVYKITGRKPMSLEEHLQKKSNGKEN
jgi:NAD(P)H dehydrogenase (quinone)